jgi:hypothetical protein
MGTLTNILSIIATLPAGTPAQVVIATLQTQLPNVNVETIRTVVELKRRLSINFSGAIVYTKINYRTCNSYCGLLGSYTSWDEASTEYVPCTTGGTLTTHDGIAIFDTFANALEGSVECAENHAQSVSSASQ